MNTKDTAKAVGHVAAQGAKAVGGGAVVAAKVCGALAGDLAKEGCRTLATHLFFEGDRRNYNKAEQYVQNVVSKAKGKQ